MIERVCTGFRPHHLQAEVIARLKRFSVLICHRRFGKTVLSVNALIDGGMRCRHKNPRFAYIAPLYKQAKKVAWDYVKEFARPIPGARFNESELRADFGNGARVSLFGADNPDALRGQYFDGVVFDEVAQMPYSVWTSVVRPALADRKGWALFIGTPQGRNALSEVWERARTDPGWYAGMYRASATDILDPEELTAAAREMAPEEYEQEFECSFTAAVRGAYYAGRLADAERDGRITSVPYEPALPVHTAWDLGVSDSTAIWFFQAAPGGEMRILDHYEASGEGLEHYAGVLREREATLRYSYGQHIAPHDIRVRELGTGKSRLEMARSLGVRFDIAPNIPVQDGINAVRALLPKCWFDATRCASGIEALQHYRREFNERMSDFQARPRHDWTSHAADAFRYLAVGFRPRVEGPRPGKTINDFRPFAR